MLEVTVGLAYFDRYGRDHHIVDYRIDIDERFPYVDTTGNRFAPNGVSQMLNPEYDLIGEVE